MNDLVKLWVHENFPVDGAHVAKVPVLFYSNAASQNMSQAFEADLVHVVHLIDDESKVLRKKMVTAGSLKALNMVP